MFIELRHVPLWRLFHYPIHILRMPHGVVHQSRAPSVAILRAGEINGIAPLHFAHIHTIVPIYGVHRASYAEQC